MRLVRLVPLLLLIATGFAPSARAVIANISGTGTAFSTHPFWPSADWDAAMLIDGDVRTSFHLDVAPGAGAEYTVDLGKSQTLTSLRIHPRQDGCCPDRFADVRVSIHLDAAGSPGAEQWGTNLFANGTNAGSGPGIVVDLPVPAGTSGRWVRIASTTDEPVDYALQLTELEIFADVPESEINRALHTQVTANAPLFGNADPSLLVNGNRGRETVHGTELIEPGFTYTLNLGSTVNLSQIVLWARQDNCCAERLSNYRVSVHPDNSGAPGPATWSVDRFTDGTNPGSIPGSKDVLTANLDPDGTFRGQWIRIEALDETVPPYALQLTEVEAFGTSEGGPALLITRDPADATAGLGQTATFDVGTIVPNGDPDRITFQWQKNGQDIPGATNDTYTTPPVLASDDNATYRCVVSYPELPSVTSAEGELRINLAYQSPAFTNRPLWGPGGWTIAQLVNGNRTDVFHGDTAIETGFAYEVDLGLEVDFDEIVIYPRQDGCCPDRLKNFRVSVHADSNNQAGAENWGADFYTDDTNPGSTAGSIVRITNNADPSGNFQGRWIRISALDDPIADYHLQMTELEAYGDYASNVPKVQMLAHPADYGTVPGRTAVFSALARIINGDPNLLTYQWTRNGTPITGATELTYTTPPLTAADADALFRLVVSYHGVPDTISEPGKLIFDGNYAKAQPATSNRPLWGALTMSALVNGIRTDFVHGDTQIAPGYAYEVDFGADVEVTRIDLYPRQDGCCAERLTNFRVQLLASDNGQPGAETWHADLFTDGTNPGSGAGTIVTLVAADGTGTFRGSWLRIISLDDPVGDYALQIAELEVYGTGTVAVPLSVEIQRTAGGLEIRWNEGVLESIDAIGGTWTAVAGATSPYAVTPTDAVRFYRVRR